MVDTQNTTLHQYAYSLDFYKQLRVGRIPFLDTAEDPERVAYHVAAVAVSSEDVLLAAFAFRPPNSEMAYIYYLAAPAKAGANERSLSVPFADVLPGQDGYSGPGVYYLEIQGHTAGLIINTDYSIEFLLNEREALESRWRTLQEYVQNTDSEFTADDIQYVDVSTTDGQLLKNYNLHYKQYTRHVMGRVALILAVLVSIEMVAMGVLYYQTAYYDNKQKTTMRIDEALESARAQLVTAQPISPKLAEVNKIAATISQAGGWLEEYRINAKGVTYLRAKMPPWIYGTYLKALGEDGEPRLLPDENMVLIERGSK